jgi:tRNA1(Val) A37 N6-methylase TrmN6
VTATDTTCDAFLGGALNIRQPAKGYRGGIDPVLLAAACPAEGAARVLDCGAGVGIVGLCVARRLPEARVALVEREGPLAEIARRNVADNALAARVDVFEADLTAPLAATPALSALAGTFDHALANPPFHRAGAGTPSVNRLKESANAMRAGSFDHWARFMAAMLRPGGTVTLIHRADALAEVMNALAGRFGGVMVVPLHPRARAPANRILVRGIKGARAPTVLEPGLVIHEGPANAYRAEIEAVLRAPRALGI